MINSVFDKAGTLAAFTQTTSRNMGVFSGVLTLFAVAMAVGIIYNAARIALSERAWELASLRVLGMTRAEVSVLLLAELGAELLVALPVGALTGWGLASLMMQLMASRQHRFSGRDRAVPPTPRPHSSCWRRAWSARCWCAARSTAWTWFLS